MIRGDTNHGAVDAGFCVRDCKGSVPILYRYRSEAEPCKARPFSRFSREKGNAQMIK
jgi:hypothetical protein